MKPYYYVLFIVAGTVAALIFVFIFFSPHNGGAETTNSTSTTTIPIFLPPTSSNTTTTNSQSVLPVTGTSSATTSTSTTTSYSVSSSLLPVSVVVSCSNDGTGFYTCEGTVTSTAGLPSGIELLNWTIDQGDLSPMSCTLVGNSTATSCGNILAGGSFSHKFTVTATYPGDSTHAADSESYSFTTGPNNNQYIVTPEFPLGSLMMVLASLSAIFIFAFVRNKRSRESQM